MHLILKKTTSIIIILSLVISLVSCSKTVKKKYNYIEDYRDVVYSFANNFGYEITDEKKSFDHFEVVLVSEDTIFLQFDLGNNNQYNRFYIYCENPNSYDEILLLANKFSRKEFRETVYFELIHGKDKYSGVDESDITYYEENYDCFRIKYLGISEDYCLEYYSYKNSNEFVISFAGFTM